MFRLLTIVLLGSVFISCRNSSNNGNGNSKDNSAIPTESEPISGSVKQYAIVEPVKKFIYYMDGVDISTYDSVATQYFHEVLDYTDSAAIALDLKIHHLENIQNDKNTSEFEKQVASDEITALSFELNQYQKEVTGYVFVHSFLNNGDTLSAIIITNADMSKGQAIPVSTPSDIEPTAFTSNIRQIDQ